MLETLPLHHLAHVISLLTRGNVVAYPTGTSYALGADALDQGALEKLDALKQRPKNKTYSILLPSSDPNRFVTMTPDEQRTLTALRNRPLTLLVKPRRALVHLALEGLVGVRTPDHPFTREFVAQLPFPVTATSANKSSEDAVCHLQDLEQFAAGGFRLYAVDGGNLVRCLPSTVAKLTGGRWEILRAGEVTREELEGALERVRVP